MKEKGIFVVLEKAWAGVDDFYPQLVVDISGKILKFSTREEAEEYNKQETQDGQVIELTEEEKSAEICNICGKPVAPGSGRYVNRVLDFDTMEERKENGRRYPEGDFICPECDKKTRGEKT